MFVHVLDVYVYVLDYHAHTLTYTYTYTYMLPQQRPHVGERLTGAEGGQCGQERAGVQAQVGEATGCIGAAR